MMGVSAQAGKVDDQRVVFLADGGGDLVGNVLFRLAAFVADVDSPVLAFQHTPDNHRFDHFGDLVGLIAGQGSFQFSHRVIDNGFQFFLNRGILQAIDCFLVATPGINCRYGRSNYGLSVVYFKLP